MPVHTCDIIKGDHVVVVDATGNIGEGIAATIAPFAPTIYISDTQAHSEVGTQLAFDQLGSIELPKCSHVIVRLHPSLRAHELKACIALAQRYAAVLVCIAHWTMMHDLAALKYQRVQRIALGDVFDLPYHEEGIWHEIGGAIRSKKKIVIHDRGVGTYLPVWYQDAIRAIVQAVFDGRNKDAVGVYPRIPMSSAQIAEVLHPAFPGMQVEYVGNLPIVRAQGLFPGSMPLPEGEELAQRIRMFAPRLLQRPRAQKESMRLPVVRTGRRMRHWGYIMLSLIVACLVSALLLGSIAYQAIARRDVSQIAWGLHSISRVTSVLQPVLPQSLKNIGEEAGAFAAMISAVFDMASGDMRSVLSDDFRVALNALHAHEAMVRQYAGDSAWWMVNTVSAIRQALPYLLGDREEKTYLVLLQNNRELRPGGGFIGSYGILRIHGGKVTYWDIYDVYDADGQMKGHIEPPFVVRRYLDVVHWYLRDSNMSLDMATNARMAARLYKESMREEVDGVITVQLSFIERLMNITGGVYIPGFNTTVTQENVYSIIQDTAQKDFFPGSTQKKDTLSAFGAGLSERIVSADVPRLIEAFREGVARKEIALWSASEPVQEIFVAQGLSGALWDEREEGVIDALGVAEINVGANKANQYIQRKKAVNTSIEAGGTMRSVITLSLTHTGPAGEGTASAYSVYVELYAQNGATLDGLVVNDNEKSLTQAVVDPQIYENPRFTPPAQRNPDVIEVSERIEGEMRVFGWFMRVLPGETSRVAARITHGVRLTGQPPLTYRLRHIQQPGVSTFELRQSFTLPPGWGIVNAADVSLVDGVYVMVKDGGITQDTDITLSR
jgi:hypothetical protein